MKKYVHRLISFVTYQPSKHWFGEFVNSFLDTWHGRVIRPSSFLVGLLDLGSILSRLRVCLNDSDRRLYDADVVPMTSTVVSMKFDTGSEAGDLL